MSRRPGWWLKILAITFPLAGGIVRATRWPIIGRAVRLLLEPQLSGKNFNITYIPINREVEGAGSSYVPLLILEKLIRESSHRAIIKRCTCRDGNSCENHPVELACLMLGDGAAEIDTGVCVHSGVEETIAHARACIDNGLIPFAGRFKPDDFLWGVKDRGRLLTICFCCRCCCAIMNNKKFMPQRSQDSIVKLRGLEMRVDPARCTRCGECVTACFAGAIEMDGGAVAVRGERCKGCGQCASLCPAEAITPVVASVDDAVNEILGRIGGIVHYR